MLSKDHSVKFLSTSQSVKELDGSEHNHYKDLENLLKNKYNFSLRSINGYRGEDPPLRCGGWLVGHHPQVRGLRHELPPGQHVELPGADHGGESPAGERHHTRRLGGRVQG